MKKVAVYGSLLKGLGNHRLLETSTLMGEDLVKLPFQMVSLGSFPGLIPSKKEEDIFIEVYEVTDEVFARLDRLEGYPHFYNRRIIDTAFGEAFVYFLEKHEAYGAKVFVEPANWRKYVEEACKKSLILS